MEPQFAEMVTCPVALLLTNPLSSMDAIEPFEDPQRTERVMSSVVLSLNVPVAVNCLMAPIGILECSRAIDSGTSAAVVPVMVVVPAAKVVALPFASIVAAESNEEVQVTPDTRSCDDPSL